MKAHKYVFLFFCLTFIFIGCRTKNVLKSESKIDLIFKVEYIDSKYPEYHPISYALITSDKLNSFKIYKREKENSPSIIYNITHNGGYYISETFIDIYTLGCCDFKDIEKAFVMNANDDLLKIKLIEYQTVNNISLNIFEDELGYKMIFKIGSKKYIINIWSAKLDYCVCNLYMNSPQQIIWGNDAAYLRNISSITTLSQDIKDKLSVILKKIILSSRN